MPAMLTANNVISADTQSALSAVHAADGNAQTILDTHTVTATPLIRDEWGPRTAYTFSAGGQIVAIVKREMTTHGRECWLTETTPVAEFGEWDYRVAAEAYRTAQKGGN